MLFLDYQKYISLEKNKKQRLLNKSKQNFDDNNAHSTAEFPYNMCRTSCQIELISMFSFLCSVVAYYQKQTIILHRNLKKNDL